MQKHFVVFLSPGTFVSEISTFEIPSWDIELAQEMAHGIVERHGATPFGFYFETRSRGPGDLDSSVTAQSKGVYYLGGVLRTAEEILAGTDPKEDILRFNVKYNHYKGVIENTNSWKITLPFNENDVLLDWTPRPKEGQQS
jgi:hypothetical protein